MGFCIVHECLVAKPLQKKYFDVGCGLGWFKKEIFVKPATKLVIVGAVVAVLAVYIAYNVGLNKGWEMGKGTPLDVWTMPEERAYSTVWQAKELGHAVIMTPAGFYIFVSTNKKIGDNFSMIVELPEMFGFHDGKMIAIGNDKNGKTIGVPIE